MAVIISRMNHKYIDKVPGVCGIIIFYRKYLINTTSFGRKTWSILDFWIDKPKSDKIQLLNVSYVAIKNAMNNTHKKSEIVLQTKVSMYIRGYRIF